jgi:hypothetical protein
MAHRNSTDEKDDDRRAIVNSKCHFLWRMYRRGSSFDYSGYSITEYTNPLSPNNLSPTGLNDQTHRSQRDQELNRKNNMVVCSLFIPGKKTIYEQTTPEVYDAIQSEIETNNIPHRVKSFGERSYSPVALRPRVNHEIYVPSSWPPDI